MRKDLEYKDQLFILHTRDNLNFKQIQGSCGFTVDGLLFLADLL